jgi:hypothetical protein
MPNQNAFEFLNNTDAILEPNVFMAVSEYLKSGGNMIGISLIKVLLLKLLKVCQMVIRE